MRRMNERDCLTALMTFRLLIALDAMSNSSKGMPMSRRV
jgi:hypothetical protein